MREEREKRKENKKKTFTILVRMLPFLRLYCSLMQNILAFITPDVNVLRVLSYLLLCGICFYYGLSYHPFIIITLCHLIKTYVGFKCR